MNDMAGWAEPHMATSFFFFFNCDSEFGEKIPSLRSLEAEGWRMAAAVATGYMFHPKTGGTYNMFSKVNLSFKS